MFINYTIGINLLPSSEKFSLNYSLPLQDNKFKHLSIVSDKFSINLGDFGDQLQVRKNEIILFDAYNDKYRATNFAIIKNGFINFITLDAIDYYDIKKPEYKIKNGVLYLEEKENIVIFEDLTSNKLTLFENIDKIVVPNDTKRFFLGYKNNNNLYKYDIIYYIPEEMFYQKVTKIEWE